MALLDHGPDLVKVYPEIEILDDFGTPRRVPSPTPVEVHTYVQALSAQESGDYDADPNTLRYFQTRAPLPAGAWARVEWAGVQWDVVGEPQRLGRSARTAHTKVVMQARAPREAGAPNG